MDRSVRAIWRGKPRRHRAEKDAAAARAAQPAAPAGPAGPAGAAPSAPDDSSAVDRPPPSLLTLSRELPSRSAAVRLAVDDSKVIAVIGGEGGDPYEWWAAIHRLASGSDAS